MARAGTISETTGVEDQARRDELVRLAGWNRFVTTPALIAVWAAGLYLAARGGWFAWHWLQLKMTCVFLLSGLHILQSLRLRNLAAGRSPGPRLGWAAMVAALLVILIVYLVAAKPA